MGRRGPRPSGAKLKSAVFSMRMRPELRSRLEDAAKANGKSLGDEIHDRLTDTLEKEQRLIAEFGGRQPYAITRLIMSKFGEVGATSYFHRYLKLAKPHDWLNDPFAYGQAADCAVRIIETFRPPGKARPPKSKLLGRIINVTKYGVGIADGALFAILQAETDLPLAASASPELRHLIADDLGPSLRRRIGPAIITNMRRGK